MSVKVGRRDPTVPQAYDDFIHILAGDSLYLRRTRYFYLNSSINAHRYKNRHALKLLQGSKNPMLGFRNANSRCRPSGTSRMGRSMLSAETVQQSRAILLVHHARRAHFSFAIIPDLPTLLAVPCYFACCVQRLSLRGTCFE